MNGGNLVKKQVFIIGLLLGIGCMCTSCASIKEMQYARGIRKLQKKEYVEASKIFEKLDTYEKSHDYRAECIFQQGKKEVQEKDYEAAIEYFEQISEYETAATMLKECKYLLGKQYIEAGDLENATVCFENITDYKDVTDLLKDVEYQVGVVHFEAKDYTKALEVFEKILDYKDVPDMMNKCRYGAAMEYFEAGDYAKSYENFSMLGDYKKSKEYMEKSAKQGQKEMYKQAKTLYNENKMEEARKVFEVIKTYKKSAEFIEKIDLFLALQNTTWVCQDKYMKEIGSMYTMVFDGFNVTVTITQGDTKDNANSEYQYAATIESFNGKWCMKYGEDTYCVYNAKKDIIKTYRNNKLQDKYKRQ